jgi:hypothetical protein
MKGGEWLLRRVRHGRDGRSITRAHAYTCTLTHALINYLGADLAGEGAGVEALDAVDARLALDQRGPEGLLPDADGRHGPKSGHHHLCVGGSGLAWVGGVASFMPGGLCLSAACVQCVRIG